MSKIFKALIVLLMCASTPAFAIRILHPGDVVKGKTIDQTFYCYTDEEQSRLIKDLEAGSLYKELAETRKLQIELLKEKVEVYQGIQVTLASHTTGLHEILKRSAEREEKMFAVLTDVKAAYDSERKNGARRRKRSFWAGVIMTAVTLLGARMLIVP